MEKDKSDIEWGSRGETEPGPAKSDPLVKLAAGVAKQALNDLRAGDLLTQLDALAWLVADDGPAPAFLDVLGYDLTHDQILGRLLDGESTI